ncbi:MAG: PilC/PilY family type IV pilus protein [Nitrospinota bacterium]|nr:PilC/PilY family type IV pilus protein [Nitrospinota bacterium]
MSVINRHRIIAVALLLCGFTASSARGETNADYSHTPISMSNTVKPNILFLMDNSGSMNERAYLGVYDPATTYYGYFTSAYKYSYASNVFTINAAGPWSGNFLNWATMRRVDVSRKVVMGGLATSRTGGGNQQNKGEASSAMWDRMFAGPLGVTAGITPYQNDATYTYSYKLAGGNMSVIRTTIATGVQLVLATFTLSIQKDQALEPNDFVSGNLAGIMQRVENQARWGLEFFNSGRTLAEGGPANGRDGGYISQAITGTGYGTNFITNFQTEPADGFTPLAESLWIAAGYFAFYRHPTLGNMDYGVNGNLPSNVIGNDPLYYSEYAGYVSCGKNFVIIITDGEPTYDENIVPTVLDPLNRPLTDYDNDGNDAVANSDFLDDVALYAHVGDLRSDIAGDQNLTIYTIFAFGDSVAAETILQETSKNGAFIDSNANKIPDLQSEWDVNGDNIPDTYFKASDGAQLESKLLEAITDILNRATSGTAISVLATSSSGAGNIFQAYFLPKKTVVEASGTRDIDWLGHLLSFNVDPLGAMRDKFGNCIGFEFDIVQNQTVVKNLSEVNGVCTTTPVSSVPLVSYSGYNWDAGEKLLSAVAPGARNIYTFLDSNEDGVCNGCSGPATGEFISFNTGNSAALAKYMKSADPANLINFVRGADVVGYRDRNISGNEWKLGDIVNSTPGVVSSPAEAYGLLYRDPSYNMFSDKYSVTGSSPRDVYAYVGANDGMLHAIRASNASATVQDGAESWAYIPYNLLPHLNWMGSLTYSRVEYVDMRPKISDVQIFPCDAIHVGSNSAGKCWGTILIGGMGSGGGEIADAGFDVDGDGDTAANLRKWRSAYFALDVTDPNSPNLLWEFGHNLTRSGLVADDNELGFAASYPAIVKVGTKWFAVFGSGTKAAYVPDYQGNSNQTGKVFVVDLETGTLAAKFAVSDATSYFADPVSVDIDFVSDNTVSPPIYNSDAVYIGETYYKATGGGSWNSRMWRIVINNDPNPANWQMSLLHNSAVGQTISAAPSVSNDTEGPLWIYWGTGKFKSTTDKADTAVQGVYGVRDVCWDRVTGAWDNACLGAASLNSSASYGSPTVTNLLDTTAVVVSKGGAITGGPGGITTLQGLADEILANYQGWYMRLTTSKERALNKPSIVGGVVLATSFIPNTDVCGFGGLNYLYSLYYKTGTAYKESTIGYSSSNPDIVLKRSETAGTGLASSVAIHAGREEGAVAYIQKSTGEVTEVKFDTVINIKSGIVAWREVW